MDRKQDLIEHLDELRSRLIFVFVFFAVFSVFGFIISGPMINRLRADLFPAGMGVELIATYPMEFFLTKINIGVFFGILLSIPVILIQIFAFIKPGMKKEEVRVLRYAIPAGFLLFLLGVCFSYFILLKVGIWFLAGITYSAGVSNFWSVNYFIFFIFMTSIAMGMVFQMPVITYVLAKMGLIEPSFLKEKRPYVIILSFTVAAVITPPDPITQILVAIPMVILFEISVLISKIFS